MAKLDKSVLLLLPVMLILSSWLPISNCSKKPVGVTRKEDIPYIKCQVCQKLAHQLYQQVQDKQTEISPKKITEYQIIEISENVCNLKKREADWILKIDIVEQNDRLDLVDQDSEGECNSECKTIERTCQEVMGYSDTDVAEYIYKEKPQIDSLIKFLCQDLTGACRTKPPKVPKDRIPGEPFVPKSEKDAEMERMLKSMEGMPGAPSMKMYSREDLMNMRNFGGDHVDDDDEDDDEIPFSSKLGNVFRENERKNKNWKRRITTGILDVGGKVKNLATKVSLRMSRWWKAKKGILKKKKKTSKSGKTEL